MDPAAVEPSERSPEPTPPEGGGPARAKDTGPRAAEPTPEPGRRDPGPGPEQRDPVDEGSEESFPASDPPAHSGTT